MVDSVFLKSARRIEALMMVMMPFQLNKEVQSPTLSWNFKSWKPLEQFVFMKKPWSRPCENENLDIILGKHYGRTKK